MAQTESARAAATAGLARAAAALAALTGWRRFAVAIAFGACATLAFAPVYLIVFLIPAFTALVWLLDGAGKPRAAFTVGFAFGVGHFLTGLYWVGIAFLVDAARFGALMPFVVGGLAALLALFPGTAALLTHRLGWRGPARVVVLATSWLLLEWLRSWVLSGFPWNLAGMAWGFSTEMSQLAAVTGVWGLSWLTVLAAAAPAMAIEPVQPADGAPPPATPRPRWAIALATLLIVPLVLWAVGAARLAGAPDPGSAVVPDVKLRLVQANIPQSLKWQNDQRAENVARQVGLTRSAGFSEITHVIWPETAVPFFLDRAEGLRRALAPAVPEGGLLITGAVRAGEPADPESERAEEVWNSLFFLDGQGAIRAHYDKFHLVPLGEYVPFRRYLGLEKLTPGQLDFSAGPGPRTLDLEGLPPLSPLICYEIIFPGAVVADGGRPRWLLNVTNDAWFGTSSGPYQHLATARLRAIEEGVPLVRAANTGISAVFDAYGRELGRIGLNQTGILDTPLPTPLDRPTPYARIQNAWVFLLILIGASYALVLRRFSP